MIFRPELSNYVVNGYVAELIKLLISLASAFAKNVKVLKRHADPLLSLAVGEGRVSAVAVGRF